LIVSIHTPKTGIDLYSAVEEKIRTPAVIEI